MTTNTCKNLFLAGVGAMTILALAPTIRPAKATSTATSPFTVSATVNATCLISAGNLSFGIYTGSQVDATSTILVTCTNTTPYNIQLSAGSGGGDGDDGGGSVTDRKMKGPNNSTLAYGLYVDAERDDVWGVTIGSNTVAGAGNGSQQSLTVYGRVPASQYVRPGAYTDTVTATVTY